MEKAFPAEGTACAKTRGRDGRGMGNTQPQGAWRAASVGGSCSGAVRGLPSALPRHEDYFLMPNLSIWCDGLCVPRGMMGQDVDI